MNRLQYFFVLVIVCSSISQCFAQGEVAIKTNATEAEYTQSKWDAIEFSVSEQRNRELEKVAEEENSKLPDLKVQLESLKLKDDELAITINDTSDKINHLTQKEALLGTLPEIEDAMSDSRNKLKKCLDERTVNEGQQRVLQLQISQIEARCAQLRSDINEKYKETIELLRQQFDDAKSTAEKLKVVQHYKELADKGDELAMLRLSDFYREGYGVKADSKIAYEYEKKWNLANEAKARTQTEDQKMKEQTALRQKFLRNVDLADNNNNVLSALYVEKCYRYGIGVKKDQDLADKYHKKAISLGIPQKLNTQMTAP